MIDTCWRLEKGDNRNVLVHESNIRSSTVSDIKAQKEKLLQFYTKSETDKAADKQRTLHKPKIEQLDKVLNEWFALEHLEGVPISAPMLIEKTKYLYDQMELTNQCALSDSWLA